MIGAKWKIGNRIRFNGGKVTGGGYIRHPFFMREYELDR